MFTQSVVCCVYVVYEQALSVSLFSSEGEKIIDKAQLSAFVELQSPNGRHKYELKSFIMRTGDTPDYGHYRNLCKSGIYQLPKISTPVKFCLHISHYLSRTDDSLS